MNQKKLSYQFTNAKPICDYDRVSPQIKTERLHRMMVAAAHATFEKPDELDHNGQLVNWAIPSNN